MITYIRMTIYASFDEVLLKSTDLGDLAIAINLITAYEEIRVTYSTISNIQIHNADPDEKHKLINTQRSRDD